MENVILLQILSKGRCQIKVRLYCGLRFNKTCLRKGPTRAIMDILIQK